MVRKQPQQSFGRDPRGTVDIEDGAVTRRHERQKLRDEVLTRTQTVLRMRMPEAHISTGGTSVELRGNGIHVGGQ